MTPKEYEEDIVDSIKRATDETYKVLDQFIEASKELPLADFILLVEDIKQNEKIRKSDGFSVLLSRAEEAERLGLQEYLESIADIL